LPTFSTNVVLIHQRHKQTDGQTDGQTDDMRSQDQALHYSASCGKNLQHPVQHSSDSTHCATTAVDKRVAQCSSLVNQCVGYEGIQ